MAHFGTGESGGDCSSCLNDRQVLELGLLEAMFTDS